MGLNSRLVVILGALAITVLSACSGSSLKPEPSVYQVEAVRRGWSFIEPSEELAKLPTARHPINFGSASLHGDQLIVGTERFGVLAFNKHNGVVAWQSLVPGGASSDVLVYGKQVFVGSTKGIFYAYPLGGGDPEWEVDLRFPIVGQPAFVAGRVIVGTIDHAMHALDASTGKVLWTYRRSSASGTTIKGGGNATIVNSKIWVGFADGSLVILEPNDGSVLQEKQFRDNLKFMDIDAAPVAYRNGVFVSSYDGRLRYLKRNGLPIWTFPKGSAKAAFPVAETGQVFLPGSDGSVYALGEKSGKRMWSYAIEKGTPTGLAYFKSPSSQTATAGLLVAASTDNFLYVLDAKSGKLMQQFSFGSSSGAYGTIAVDKKNGAFYVVSHYGRVYQFKVQ